MKRIIVKKVKTGGLTDFLLSMQPGDEAVIKYKEFRPMTVFQTCYRLQRRKPGVMFKCSTKQMADGCRVERIA